jgi:hypothetical protein
MSTTYVLFGMSERAAGGTPESGAFATGGRTRWRAQLDVARWVGAGNLEVVLEASPTGAEGSWVQVATFGVLTDAGGAVSIVKDSTKDPAEFTTAITGRDAWCRARIASQTAAKVTFSAKMWAPWLDHTFQADKSLLSPELLSFTSGIDRVMAEAEFDVGSLLMERMPRFLGVAGLMAWGTQTFNWHAPDIVSYVSPEGVDRASDVPREQVMSAGLDLPGFLEAVRFEVALQAEHLFQREQLRRMTGDREAQISWRKMGRFAPGLGQRLQAFRPRDRDVWRGR